jgi:hypothetical protein
VFSVRAPAAAAIFLTFILGCTLDTALELVHKARPQNELQLFLDGHGQYKGRRPLVERLVAIGTSNNQWSLTIGEVDRTWHDNYDYELSLGQCDLCRTELIAWRGQQYVRWESGWWQKTQDRQCACGVSCIGIYSNTCTVGSSSSVSHGHEAGNKHNSMSSAMGSIHQEPSTASYLDPRHVEGIGKHLSSMLRHGADVEVRADGFVRFDVLLGKLTNCPAYELVKIVITSTDRKFGRRYEMRVEGSGSEASVWVRALRRHSIAVNIERLCTDAEMESAIRMVMSRSSQQHDSRSSLASLAKTLHEQQFGTS